VFRELRDHYGVSFVFSTATQEAVGNGGNNNLPKGVRLHKRHE